MSFTSLIDCLLQWICIRSSWSSSSASRARSMSFSRLCRSFNFDIRYLRQYVEYRSTCHRIFLPLLTICLCLLSSFISFFQSSWESSLIPFIFDSVLFPPPPPILWITIFFFFCRFLHVCHVFVVYFLRSFWIPSCEQKMIWGISLTLIGRIVSFTYVTTTKRDLLDAISDVSDTTISKVTLCYLSYLQSSNILRLSELTGCRLVSFMRCFT